MVSFSFLNRFEKRWSFTSKICPISINHYYIRALYKPKSLDHCLPFTFSGLNDDFCSFSFRNLTCVVFAVSVNHQNINKTLILEIFDNLSYCCSFVQSGNKNTYVYAVQVSHISFAWIICVSQSPFYCGLSTISFSVEKSPWDVYS